MKKISLPVYVRLDKETYQKVKGIAQVYGLSVSTVVRMLVNVGLGNREVAEIWQKIKPEQSKNLE
jgi:hypothetical protein